MDNWYTRLMNLDPAEIIYIIVVTANWVFRFFKHFSEFFKTFNKFFSLYICFTCDLAWWLRFLIFLQIFIIYCLFGKNKIQINRLDNTSMRSLIWAFNIFLCLFLQVNMVLTIMQIARLNEVAIICNFISAYSTRVFLSHENDKIKRYSLRTKFNSA